MMDGEYYEGGEERWEKIRITPPSIYVK